MSSLSQLDELFGTGASIFNKEEVGAVKGAELPTQDDIPGTLQGRKNSSFGKDGGRVFEQYWHKPAAVLFASGYQPQQVADALGRHISTIRSINETPWFQEMVSTIVMKNGGKDMLEIFRQDAADAHALLVELRKNEKTPVQYRVKLATDAVERYYGKATQRIEHGEITSSDPVAEEARLRRENELLRAAQTPSLS